MKPAHEIIEALRNFTGTETWTRYSPMLFRKVLITDGVRYLAEECGCYWLLDAISSHLPAVRQASESFCIPILTVGLTKAVLVIGDDVPPNVVYATQAFEYTDFPLDEIRLYASWDGENWIILLPSEY